MKKESNSMNDVLGCVGVHELIDYQIIKYRQSVDEHRIDLSKAEGRCVSWQEAEQDFTRKDQSELSETARVEYCGLVCPHSKNCLIAMQFLQSRKTQRISRVG